MPIRTNWANGEQWNASDQNELNASVLASESTLSSVLKQGGVQVLTAPTTLAAAANTEYIYQCSWASSDPLFDKVVTLNHFDGSNGSAGPWLDSSLNASANQLNAFYTGSPTMRLNTSTKRFGTASLYYDGSQKGGAYTDSANAYNLNFLNFDFTVEFWFSTPNAAGGGIIIDWRPNQAGPYPTFYFTGGTIRYHVNGDRMTSGSIASNTWYHVAVSRSGTNNGTQAGSTRMFINGTQVGSTMTDGFRYAGVPLIAQSGLDVDGAGTAFYIDELRVTYGAARYTSNFTAPTAAFPEGTVGNPTLPTAVGNTSSYIISNINQNGYIRVYTTSNQTISGSGISPSGWLDLPPNTSVRVVSDGANWKVSGTVDLYSPVPNAYDAIPKWLANKALSDPKVTRILDSGGQQCVSFDNGVSSFGGGDRYGTARMYVSNIHHGAEFNTKATDGGWFSAYFSRTASTGSLCGFYYGGGYNFVGSISTNGSSTSFNTTSDYRLKENVSNVTGGLEAVNSLRPVKFRWKYGDRNNDVGFIAHELADVLPHVVKGEKDAVDESGNVMPQTVDYSKIIPTLASAIKELSAKLDAAEARISALEAANNNGG